MTTIRIKENSLLARVAAHNLKADKMALVLGCTIYLHNTSREEFLRNTKWVKHEVAHVKQFQQKFSIPTRIVGKIKTAFGFR